MPGWLQVVASLNPLSFAIEPIRYLYLHPQWSFSSIVMQAPWGSLTLGTTLLLLVGFDGLALLGIQRLLQRKLA